MGDMPEIITLDFETFYGDEYTLSKMTTEAYIRDPRFEIHGVGLRDATKEAWASKSEFEKWAPTKDWSKVAVLCHHAHFDGLILSHHYGIKPGYWLDTLSMARLILGNHLPASLENLAKHFNLSAKSIPYNLFKNKHWHELDPATQKLVADGCLHDVHLTYGIFQRLATSFPAEEYAIVDTTIRMFTEPMLRGDTQVLAELWTTEETRKSQARAELNVTEEELQSADKFAKLLREAGAIEESNEQLAAWQAAGADLTLLPYIKAGKNGPIYAFAKTDQFMLDLQENENPRIANLALARLGAKSTIDQTRAERLGDMAMRGALCVYLNMYAAHTTRWGGGDKVNFQNFRRAGQIRKAIMAPTGYMLGIVDASQIECRILNYLAGQEDVLDKFRRGEDPYIDIASKFYGFQVTKEHKKERGTGKQLTLSCGYQAGAQTIVNTAKLGTYGPPVHLTLEQGLEARDLYRHENPGIVKYWKEAGKMIPRIASFDYPPTEWGPMLIKGGRIYGPNGTWLNYTTLEYDKEWESWKIKTRRGWTRIYSGKLVENIVQWLARIVISQAMNRLRPLLSAHNIKIVTTSHDELVFALPITPNMLETFEHIKQEFKRTPTWLPGIPLDCEGTLSERYEK